MEDAIVLYPSQGVGHLISMVELGKLILTHHPSFVITILISTAPYDTGSTASYISHVSTTTPSITFHHLPTISVPPSSSSTPLFSNTLALSFELPRLNNPNLRQTLQTISLTSNIKAFIIDFFCNPSFEVSTNLNIPTYYFFTSGSNGLAVFLYFPTIHRKTTTSLKDLDMVIDVPGIPPFPSTDMPTPLLDRSPVYDHFLNTATQMSKAAGIIVNTFELLEPRAIRALSDGLCVPDGPTPSIFCVGPLIATKHEKSGGGDGQEYCLSWLNSQPSRSVVFLCFGSMGLFSAEQLKEIATGLERSGVRFLWVVRNPPTGDNTKRSLATPEPSLDSLFPEGFLDRIKDRGFVVRSWAPQVEVLSHDSVGGFVTHCGWNSILEAVYGGVPMLAWPLYAEQRMNRVILVEEMKLALSVNESENRFVSAAELEERVRELMDSEKGRAVRKQVMAMRDGAVAARRESGSSRVALAKLAESFKRGLPGLNDSDPEVSGVE